MNININKDIANVERHAKFVWDKKTIDTLINLYSENVNDFLNPCKVQTTLWRNLVKIMKKDDKIPLEVRDCLTHEVARRKWLSLQKKFKAAFYNPEMENKFPFFEKMNKLFSEYAESHLNSSFDPFATNESINKTTDAEVTAYIMHLLDNEDFDNISLLRCEPTDQDAFTIKSSTSYSAATQVRKELAKLPKESICVQETKLKIVPNTPFNRQYQLSTILKQRDCNRQNISDNVQKIVKKRSSSMAEKNVEISVIQTRADSFDYEIHALNECNFTDISDVKRPDIKRIKMYDSQGDTSSDLQILNEKSISILEVPSFDSIEIEDFQPPSPPRVTSVITKKLQFQDESFNENDEQPPKWFQAFLSSYNANMKRIDDKLSAIDDKLNKVLNQRSKRER